MSTQNINKQPPAPEFSDDDIASRFAKLHIGDIYFVHAAELWWVKRQNKWCADRQDIVRQFIRVFCRTVAYECSDITLSREISSEKTIASVERLARHDPRLMTSERNMLRLRGINRISTQVL
jgi:hypothetical protein